MYKKMYITKKTNFSDHCLAFHYESSVCTVIIITEKLGVTSMVIATEITKTSSRHINDRQKISKIKHSSINPTEEELLEVPTENSLTAGQS
jgi:hypothetical protein